MPLSLRENSPSFPKKKFQLVATDEKFGGFKMKNHHGKFALKPCPYNSGVCLNFKKPLFQKEGHRVNLYFRSQMAQEDMTMIMFDRAKLLRMPKSLS